MLLIDENMFRLAKMQETLLKVEPSNRSYNLEKYKEIVTKIDSSVFISLFEEAKCINVYNHTLKDELEFLERIKEMYNQLNELQYSFKSVCESCSDYSLKLSDLSQINIDYIEKRIDIINGYLINCINIEKNKKDIEKLSNQLIEEEKKKYFINDKLMELENILRNNFLNAEGRLLVDEKLEYTSILTEYQKLGLNAKDLLEDSEKLEELLLECNKEKDELAESVRAAEVCYDNLLTKESKQILNDIKKEELIVKYKLTMLKIIKLLSQDTNNYDSFIDKREQLIDLIKYRSSCMYKLDIKMSIDPFDRIKIKEQLELVLSFVDNAKVISNLMKEISELNSRTEEMIEKNNEYLNSLNDIESLVISRVSFSDINETVSNDYDFESMLLNEGIRDNQVIDVKDISSQFNLNVVKQKTDSVIKRVSEMLINQDVFVEEKTDEVFIPELVIVPKKEIVQDDVIFESVDISEVEDLKINEEIDNEEEKIVSNPSAVVDVSNINLDMFETTVPFEEPAFFVDRTDDVVSSQNKKTENSLTTKELLNISNKPESNFEIKFNDVSPVEKKEDSFSDTFWVVSDDNMLKEQQTISSFESQTEKSLSTENKHDKRIRKKVS